MNSGLTPSHPTPSHPPSHPIGQRIQFILGALLLAPVVWAQASPTVAPAEDPCSVTLPTDFPNVMDGEKVDREFLFEVLARPECADEKKRTCFLAFAAKTIREKLKDPKILASRHISTFPRTSDFDQLELLLGTVAIYQKGRDPYALQLDFYAAVHYSNLFRGTAKDEGFFSKSGSALLMEMNQTFTANRRWEVFGVVGSTTTSAVTGATAAQSITSAGNVMAKGGVMYFPARPWYGWLGLGAFAAGGVLGVPGGSTSTGITANEELKSAYEAGAIVRQLAGEWQNSYLTIGYARDPRFDHHDRFVARGRLVVSPETKVGTGVLNGGLGAFLEGSISSGRGPTEARVTIGVKVDTIAVLRSIAGLSAGSAPAGTSAGSSPTGTSAQAPVKPEDMQINAVVASRLKGETRFDKVTAVSVAGVVTLAGTVATERDKTDAAAVVQATAGVTQLVNNVVVARPDDTQLAAVVAAKLKSEERFGKVVVKAANGVVTLSGSVPNAVAKSDAGALAKATAGVTQVADSLEVDVK